MPPDRLARIAMTGIGFTNTLTGDEAAKRAQRRHARFVNTAMVATLHGRPLLRPARGRTRHQRRRRPARPHRHGARARRRPLHRRPAQHAPAGSPHGLQHRLALCQRDRAADAARHRRHRVRHRRSARASPTATSSSRCWTSPTAPFSPRSSGRRKGPASSKAPSRCRRAAAGNRAERIAAALAPARSDGTLPAFPLGTEMTEVEQALTGPLTRLRSAGYADLVRMLLAGLTPRPHDGRAARRSRSTRARRRQRPRGPGDARPGAGRDAAGVRAQLPPKAH